MGLGISSSPPLSFLWRQLPHDQRTVDCNARFSRSPYKSSHTHSGAGNAAFAFLADEPDVSFDPAYFDIGFISNKGGSGFVVIVVNKRLDDEGGSPGVVGDLLVRDPDVVKVFESLGSLTQGESKVDMKSQTKSHDMGIMPAELQGRSILGKRV